MSVIVSERKPTVKRHLRPGPSQLSSWANRQLPYRCWVWTIAPKDAQKLETDQPKMPKLFEGSLQVKFVGQKAMRQWPSKLHARIHIVCCQCIKKSMGAPVMPSSWKKWSFSGFRKGTALNKDLQCKSGLIHCFNHFCFSYFVLETFFTSTTLDMFASTGCTHRNRLHRSKTFRTAAIQKARELNSQERKFGTRRFQHIVWLRKLNIIGTGLIVQNGTCFFPYTSPGSWGVWFMSAWDVICITGGREMDETIDQRPPFLQGTTLVMNHSLRWWRILCWLWFEGGKISKAWFPTISSNTLRSNCIPGWKDW